MMIISDEAQIRIFANWPISCQSQIKLRIYWSVVRILFLTPHERNLVKIHQSNLWGFFRATESTTLESLPAVPESCSTAELVELNSFLNRCSTSSVLMSNLKFLNLVRNSRSTTAELGLYLLNDFGEFHMYIKFQIRSPLAKTIKSICFKT